MNLEYEPPPAAETWIGAIRSVGLVALPLIATFALFIVLGMNAADEPYGFFTWPDAMLQVGGPVGVTILWLLWFALLWIRSRFRTLPSLCGLLWGGLNIYFAYAIAKSYFGEPWAFS